ncbi:MAG: helix-hairpin-helix domain-containing protein [Saprospiraceae bacterium]|nr:helix-hairpin-helix domain-containing protein [Saprospiraceae bacterium]
MNLRFSLIVLALGILPPEILSQNADDLTVIQDQVEAYLENLDEAGEFLFTGLIDELMHYWRQPLSLNTASEDDLYALGLLNDIQIVDLLQYRSELGAFLSIYEIQSIPSFDHLTIRRILPFVTVKETPTQAINGLWQSLGHGRDQLLIRWSRSLPKSRGFRPEEPEADPSFLGDPNQWYLRYRHNNQNKVSYGITMEKDPGEPFSPSKGKTPDYFSAHFLGQDLYPGLKYLAIGDFAISLGQGLIMHSGFSTGKSSQVTRIKRGSRTIRPYTSLDESAHLRGIASKVEFGKWTCTAFVSSRRRDANLIISLDSTQISFSSLQTSGLHRTSSEIQDRKSVRNAIFGLSTGFESAGLKINLNGVINHFNLPFERRDQPYNQFRFRGRSLVNASIDYRYVYKNFHWFGELAFSDNKGLAAVNGVLIGLGRVADLALLHRAIGRSYDALQSNAFLESSISSAEHGVYIGNEIRLRNDLKLSLYGDFWSHRWLRFQADAPTEGHEYFIRLTYYQKRAIESYIQYKSEEKARNFRQEGDIFNQIYSGKRRNLRLHLSNRVTSELELRTRLEFSWASNGPGQLSKGILVYQDLIFKSLESPWSFAARLAYFDTDDFASRIYAYENDVLNSFSIPAFSDEGLRYYLKVRHDLSRNVMLEARWDQSNFRFLESIGSGQDLITGNRRSRLKAQMRIIL